MKFWKLGALLSMLYLPYLQAKNFSLSPGVSLSSANRSDQLSKDGKNLLKQEVGLGFNLDAEIKIYKSLSLLVNGQWIGGEGHSQYNYTNKKNPLEQAALNDIKTNYSLISGGLGARLRFLEVRGVVAFLGYLSSKGKLILSHDENQFLFEHYSNIGWKDKEEQSIYQSSFEIGLELFPERNGRLHIVGRTNKIRSDAFETLGDKKLSFNNYQLLILYRHIF